LLHYSLFMVVLRLHRTIKAERMLKSHVHDHVGLLSNPGRVRI
jgi:hypothetical protein